MSDFLGIGSNGRPTLVTLISGIDYSTQFKSNIDLRQSDYCSDWIFTICSHVCTVNPLELAGGLFWRTGQNVPPASHHGPDSISSVAVSPNPVGHSVHTR